MAVTKDAALKPETLESVQEQLAVIHERINQLRSQLQAAQSNLNSASDRYVAECRGLAQGAANANPQGEHEQILVAERKIAGLQSLIGEAEKETEPLNVRQQALAQARMRELEAIELQKLLDVQAMKTKAWESAIEAERAAHLEEIQASNAVNAFRQNLSREASIRQRQEREAR
jgi:hypothetical protein